MSGPLISADLLRSRLGAVTVLDVRYRLGGPPGREEFEDGHVPGSAYVDLGAELAAHAGDGEQGRHPLPDSEVFVAAMRRAGVGRQRPVVVLDDWHGRAASRCWWLLRHHDHPDVRVLDGGWAAWVAEGGEVEIGPERPRGAGDFAGEPGGMPVVDALAAPGVAVLVDARAPERFRGESEPVDPVAGHVPGAVNVPTDVTLDEEGRFRDGGTLTDVFAAVGAGPRTDVATYCGSGVTACHGVLAMELAGIRAALYPGSWSEWVSDPARPVETG